MMWFARAFTLIFALATIAFWGNSLAVITGIFALICAIVIATRIGTYEVPVTATLSVWKKLQTDPGNEEASETTYLVPEPGIYHVFQWLDVVQVHSWDILRCERTIEDLRYHGRATISPKLADRIRFAALGDDYTGNNLHAKLIVHIAKAVLCMGEQLVYAVRSNSPETESNDRFHYEGASFEFTIIPIPCSTV